MKFFLSRCISSISIGIILLFPIIAITSTAYAKVELNSGLEKDSACQKASDYGESGCASVTSSGTGIPNPESVIKSGINTALMILGGVSVIMIVYAGFRFSLAGGDPQAVKAARNTILYAVAGIVIAILSYTIVNWVTDNLLIK